MPCPAASARSTALPFLTFLPFLLFLLAALAVAAAAEDRQTATPARGELDPRVVLSGSAASELPLLAVGARDLRGIERREVHLVQPQPAPWAGIDPDGFDLTAAFEPDASHAGLTSPTDAGDTVALVSAAADIRLLDLVRDGDRFVLRCDAVPMAPREQNGSPRHPWRQVIAVTLGRLDARAYTIDLSVTWREPNANASPLFHQVRRQSASLTFTVAAAGAATADPAPAITDAQAPGAAAPDAPGAYHWLVPRALIVPLAFRLEAAQGLAGVGRVDLDVIAQAKALQVPTVGARAGAAGTLAAVIVGPRLNSGEWLRLRSLESFVGRRVATVEVWRDHGGRDANRPHRDLVVVPLALGPGEDPATTVVDLRWRTLYAEDMGGSYVEAPDAPVDAPPPVPAP